MKNKLAACLVKVGEVSIKNAVCSASPFSYFQPKEPQRAREKFVANSSK